MEPQKFSLTKRADSFYYASAGIRKFVKTEHNAWLHAASSIGVIALTIFYPVSGVEAILLVFAIGLVWTAELLNTCIEKTMDFITTERKPQIEFIKDMSAGAVLITAFVALITGLIIFVPKIFS
jgi:diacylglycerol kinase (ATP)